MKGKIGIIGGGVSAHLLAYQIFKHKLPLEVLIFASTSELITGPAYKTSLPDSSLMNVPAANLFLDADNSLTFQNYVGVDGYTFLPRHLYGEYLLDFFSKIKPKIQYHSKAFSVDLQLDKYIITDENTNIFTVDYLVLATGNDFLKLPTKQIDWESCSAEKPVIIIGSGLSAIDIILEIESEAETRSIKPYYKVLSLNGSFPAFHPKQQKEAGTKKFLLNEEELKGKPLSELVALYKELKSKQSFTDNRAFIDAFRPFTAKLFSNFTLNDKQEFLSKYQGFWNLFRHRMAFEVHEKLSHLRFIEKRLNISKISSYAIDIHSEQLKYLNKNGEKALSFSGLYNAVGTIANIRQSENPALQAIIQNDLFQVDSNLLGLKVDTHYKLFNSKNEQIKTAFAMGNLCKGSLWECTAIPEIREQAKAIANDLKQIISN